MNFAGCIQYSILVLYETILLFCFKAYSNMDDRKKDKTIYIILSLALLAIMTMFRSEAVGNDTDNYIAMYNRIASSDVIPYIKNSITEPGFILYCWLLTRLSLNPQLLFIVTGLIVYYSVGRFIWKYVSAPGLICYSIVALMKFDFFMSAVRQALAISILLFAFDYILNKKIVPFTVLTIIAVLIHYSSLIFFIIYGVYNLSFSKTIKLDRKFYISWSIGLFIVMLVFQKIINILLRFFPKYSYYEGSALFDGEPRLALLLQAAVNILVFVMTMLLLTEEEKKNSNIKIFTFLAIVNISIIVIATNATALNRLCASLSLFPIAHYSSVLSGTRIKYKNNRQILVFASLFWFYLYGLLLVAIKTPEWYTTYPYSFAVLF